ncbi:hypothetical protein [Neisseria polysaccharea]|nr:hypothetical protein [Neisseria polysaccharea]
MPSEPFRRHFFRIMKPNRFHPTGQAFAHPEITAPAACRNLPIVI